MDAIRKKIIADITSIDLTKTSFNINNPSQKDVEIALDGLIGENHNYEYIDSHPQILIDRLLKDKPELSLNNNSYSPKNQIDIEPKKKGILSSLISWLVGIFLIIVSLGVMPYSVLAGVAILVAGLLFLPPIHNLVLSKLNINIHWLLKTVLAVGFIFYASNALIQNDKKEFQANREAIITDLKQKISDKDYLGAKALASKYDFITGDKDLKKLQRQANEALEKEEKEREAEIKRKEKIAREKAEKQKQEEERIALKKNESNLLQKLKDADKKDFETILPLYKKLHKGSPENKDYEAGVKKYSQEKSKALLAKLKKVKASDFAKNIELYSILATLNPDNKKYKEKINFYQEKERKNKEKIAREKVEEHEKQRQKEQGLMWNYQESVDKMSDKTIKYAFVDSLNKFNFSFPYSGAQRARLQLRKHPKHGRDVILSIDKGQFICTSYSGCKVAVRFDKGKTKIYNAVGPSDNSSTSIFIRNYKRFVAKAKKAKKVYIQAEFYQQGSIVMEFNIEGLSF